MPKSCFNIDKQGIGPGYPPYMIAEMSGNHNGDLQRAIDLMVAAKEAGANAVKLQTYTADTLTIDHNGKDFRISGGLWDGYTLYELYQEAHTPWDWHPVLFEKGRELGISIFSSPFDESAVEFLEELGCPAYKIASFEAVDIALIRRVAATGKPIIISTGMAGLEEIEDALSVAKEYGVDCALLHCISAYPAPVKEANLMTIPDLAARFGVVSGLSDHTLGTAVSVAAVSLGANIIEKHFTLARSDGGPDAAFSLEKNELAYLVQSCTDAWSAIGEVTYNRQESEKESLIFRRSLYVVEDIEAGVELTEKNIRCIRPGYGLPPKNLNDVLGRKAAQAILRGTALTWSLIAD